MFIVTGAAGFIGSAMVWELNQRGIKEIVVVDNFGHDQRWKNLLKREFVEFVMKDDLFNYLNHPDVTTKVQAIIHMGACSSTTETNVDFLIENNYYYSQALFKWCADKRKTFVYASSGATYGSGELGFDDTTNSNDLKPLNAYGYSKVLFDRWVQKQKHTPPRWVGLKFFNVFGPQEYHKESMRSLVTKAFDEINTTEEIKLFKSHRADYGDGLQKRDFVYIKDVTRWIWEIIEKKSFVNGIYNMGFGEARTWVDLANACFKNLGKSTKINFIEIPESIRNQYQYFTQANMAKLMDTGLSKPQWPLELAVEDYYQNYLLKPDPYL